MQELNIPPSDISPEIILSHKENIFLIKGQSRPENVREVYEPVLEWLDEYKNVISTEESIYTREDPFILQFNLEYFNSSTAKYLYDIIMIIKSLKDTNVPVAVTWFYDPAETEGREAGEDLASLADLEFVFMKRQAQ